MKFSIRDLFLVTMIVALGVGWGVVEVGGGGGGEGGQGGGED